MSLHQPRTGSVGAAAGGATSTAACSPSTAKPVPAAEVLQRLEAQREQLSKNQVKRLRKQLAKKVKQENDSSATATAVTTSSRDDEADASLTQPPTKRARHDLHSHNDHQHQQLHSGATCSDAAQPCSSTLVGCSGHAVQQLQHWAPAAPLNGLQAAPVQYGLPSMATGVYGIAALPVPTPQQLPGPMAAGRSQGPAMLASGHLCGRPPAHRRGNHVDFSAAAMLITWAGAQDETTAIPAAVAAAAMVGGRSSFSAGGGVQRQQPCRTDLSGGVLLVSQEMEAMSSGSGSRAGGPAAVGRARVAEAESVTELPGPGACAPRKQQQQQQQDQDEQNADRAEEAVQHAEHAEQEGQAVSKRQSRQRFIYGNYHNYYGLRLGHDRHEDPRVKLLDPNWFRDQDCLDIGCNEGVVTLALATKFGTRRMTGVDIDRVLVSKAATNLAQMRSRLTQQLHARTGGGRDAVQPPCSLNELRRRIKALAHTEFRNADWVGLPCGPCKYEAITVFSVTKWIHLHYGDDGLMGFFHKLFRSLVPGGVLVLEPQPWKSYQNAKNKQVLKEVPFAERIDQLHLRPSGFADFLTQRVGFELLCTLQVDADEAAQGFDRPMLVLRRPAAAPASDDPLAQLYESV